MKTDLETLIEHLAMMDWCALFAGAGGETPFEVGVMDIVENDRDDLDTAMDEAEGLGLEIDPDDLKGWFFYYKNSDGVVVVKNFDTQRKANKLFVEAKNLLEALEA